MAVEAWFSNQTAIFIQEQDGTEINFTVKVLSIKEGGFERETEGIVTFGDGRIVQKKPQKDGTVEVEFVMKDTLADKIFWGSTVAGTVPATILSGGLQNPHRITFVRTADATIPTTAITAGGDTLGETYRRAYVEAFAVLLEPEHEADGFLRGKLTFTVAPTDDAADPNVRTDYVASGGLTGLGAYTAANKF